MNATDLCYTPASTLSAMIRRREISPVELMKAVLGRIEAAQPVLNAFITITAETAMAEARAAEAAVMKGNDLKPLHGIPFSVKDLVNTAGVRTTFGSLVLEHNVPKADAVCVARLKAAGAILVGKTTTPEFGHKPLTEAPLFGRTRNAWAADRTSGGSSGGAAVAMAAGLAPLAVASDGGGSTRIPASCNGVVGFKQTQGRVPHDMTTDAFGYLAYLTPTTRTVRDTALMLQAMAGPDDSDPHSLAYGAEDFVASARGEGDLEGLRVAWRPFVGNTVLDPEVKASCAAGAAALGELGARVEEMADDFPPTEPVWLVINNSFWHARYGGYLAEHRARMSETLVRQLDAASHFSAVDLQKAMFERTRLYRQIQGWFGRFDVIAMPTLARTAIPIDHDFFQPIEIAGKATDTVRKAWYPYTHPFNLSGNPAVTVPCGWAADGLPIGLHLVGRRGADALLLRVAALFEKARPWADRRPALPELDR